MHHIFVHIERLEKEIYLFNVIMRVCTSHAETIYINCNMAFINMASGNCCAPCGDSIDSTCITCGCATLSPCTVNTRDVYTHQYHCHGVVVLAKTRESISWWHVAGYSIGELHD
jgi:hypothetical protein